MPGDRGPWAQSDQEPSADDLFDGGIGAAQVEAPDFGLPEEQLARVATETRRIEAHNAVKNHVMVALTFGLVPSPLFDVAMLVGNQVSMVRALAGRYGQPFDKGRSKAVILSLIGGSASVLAVVALSSGVKIIPGIGTLTGSGGVAMLGGAVTYALGRTFIAHFESGGTLRDCDAARFRAAFRRELGKGREAVARLTHKAGPPIRPG